MKSPYNEGIVTHRWLLGGKDIDVFGSPSSKISPYSTSQDDDTVALWALAEKGLLALHPLL